MKKFISMVMAAAMVVTMVPATAFALDGEVEVAAKVLKAVDVNTNDSIVLTELDEDVPELRIVATDVKWKGTHDNDSSVDFKITLNNAEWEAAGDTITEAEFEEMVTVVCADDTNGSASGAALGGTIDNFEVNSKNNTIEFTFTHCDTDGEPCAWHEDDALYINLETVLTKTKVGTKATVSVKAADLGLDLKDEVFATVVKKGIKAELDDTMAVVAEEEITQIDPIVIKTVVGDLFTDVLRFRPDVDLGANEYAKMTLELSKGFEWANTDLDVTGDVDAEDTWTEGWDLDIDGDEIEIILTEDGWASRNGEMTLSNLEVEATTAKAGDVATVTIKAAGVDTVKVADVAKVIDYKVVMTLVDADEDVPVFYNGVNSANFGLTVDDDHEALAVNIAETFKGAWSNHKEFTLSLPAGVHVVDVVDTDGNFEGIAAPVDGLDDTASLLWNAYQEGDHEKFVFEKRVFEETDPDNDEEDELEMEFTLVLTADPDFVGDVVLTLEGAALDTQEVTIAKFVAPYTVKTEQNDVIIDYRYTEVPTEIVITEAEAGLWADGLNVEFAMEDLPTLLDDFIVFEEDATVTVNAESGMEIDDEVADDGLGFEVTEESDEEPAVITISGIELFMQRTIPAGPYALEVALNDAVAAFEMEGLFAPDAHTTFTATHADDCDDECFVEDVADFSEVVNEAWINVVTAGREQSDSSFTTEVVVPVGETTIYAGDKAITLDVPAYINANGYIMVPVRAVANALGIANDCVQWNQASKTVIIMYGDRLITMTAGSSVIYVGGTPLPSTSSVEIVDGRAFLGLRDLANALGVKSIAWDPATKVGTLNPKA